MRSAGSLWSDNPTTGEPGVAERLESIAHGTQYLKSHAEGEALVQGNLIPRLVTRDPVEARRRFSISVGDHRDNLIAAAECRPDRRIRDSTRLGVEKTTHLVSAGAYRYIRHPLYASLLCFGWGTFLKQPSWLGLALVAITTVALYLTARVEETENLQHFGGEYADYVRQTRMFVPFVF